MVWPAVISSRRTCIADSRTDKVDNSCKKGKVDNSCEKGTVNNSCDGGITVLENWREAVLQREAPTKLAMAGGGRAGRRVCGGARG